MGMSTAPRIVAQFAKRVRELRLRKDISQERLGEIAGLHRTYIGMIERAEKNITLVNLEKVAKALGVKPSSLID
jgi:transcriptional regulator with XRE-family HTH domain